MLNVINTQHCILFYLEVVIQSDVAAAILAKMIKSHIQSVVS